MTAGLRKDGGNEKLPDKLMQINLFVFNNLASLLLPSSTAILGASLTIKL